MPIYTQNREGFIDFSYLKEEEEEEEKEREGFIDFSYLKKEDKKKEEPKEEAITDPYRLSVLENIKTDVEKTLFNEIEDYYEERGSLTPSKKMYGFNKLIKEGKLPEEAASEIGLWYNKEKKTVELFDEEKEFYSNIYNRKLKTISQKKKEKSKDPFEKDLWERLKQGSAQFGAGSYALLSHIDPTGTFKVTSDQLYEAADIYKERSQRGESDIAEAWKSGKKGRAAGEAILQVAENLPMLTMLATGNAAGMTTGTLSFMGGITAKQKYKELEDEDIPEATKIVNSIASGLNEIVFESVGTVPILNAARKAVRELGEKQAKNVLAKAYGSEMERVLASLYGGTSNAIREGASEWATEYSNNVVDKATVDPNIDLKRNTTNAFIVGTLMGKGMSIPIDVANAKSYISDKINKLPENFPVENKFEATKLLIEKDDPFKKDHTKKKEGINQNLLNLGKIGKEKETFLEEQKKKIREDLLVEPKIKEEIKYAERIGKKVKEPSKEERLIKEEEGRLRVRDVTKDRLETKPPEEKGLPKEIKPIAFKHAGQQKFGKIIEKQKDFLKVEDERGTKHTIRKGSRFYSDIIEDIGKIENLKKGIKETIKQEKIEKEKPLETKIEENKQYPFEEKRNIVKHGVDFGFEIDENDVRKATRKFFSARGYIPKSVFNDWIRAKGSTKARTQDVEYARKDFNTALKGVYGKTKLGTPKVSKQQREQINEALGNKEKIKNLPEGLREVTLDLRNQIDAMSREYIHEGIVEGDLAATFDENMGMYLSRTYKVHSDPKWKWDNIPEEVKRRAFDVMQKELPDKSPEEVEGLLRTFTSKEGFPGAVMQGRKLGQKDLSILKKRSQWLTEHPEIRDLMGEYKDPLYNYATSMHKMANLIEKHKFLEKTREDGLGEYLFEEPVGKYSEPIASKTEGTMSPLNGLYTTPEIAEAFKKFNEIHPISDMMRRYMQVNAAVKYGKTIFSFPKTHMRNYTANYLFHTANGRNIFKGEGAHKTVIQGMKGTKQEFRDKFKKYIELGIVGESAKMNELHDVVKDVYKDYEDFDKMGDKFLKKAKNKTFRGLEKLYQLEDDVHKVYAFEYEKDRYKPVFKKKNPNATPEEIEAMAEEKAAEVTRNTMPTYSLVPESIKMFRRSPIVGTFVSFPAEVIRTSYNTLDLATQEIKDPDTRHIGAKRMAGAAFTSVATGGLAALSRAIFGVDNDEMDDVRRFVAPWSKNSELTIVGKPKDGLYRYVDVGYTDPHHYLKNVIVCFKEGVKKKDLDEAFVNSAKEMLEPFLGEEILAGRIKDVLSNQRSGTRGRIYNPDDPQKGLDILKYLWQGVEPGTISSIKRMYMGAKGVKKGAKQYDLWTELAAEVGGQRVTQLDIGLAFMYKVKRASDRMADTKFDYYKETKRGLSEEKLTRELEKTNKILEGIFTELSEDYEAARRLGVDKKELNNILRGMRIGGFNAPSQLQYYIKKGKFKGLDEKGRFK
jgi:hypothetical protein